MLRFLLADDHSIVVTGLKISLTQKYPFCKVDTAKNGNEVFDLVKKNDYDVAIIDVNMPGTDTSNLIHQLLSVKNKLRLLIFSMYPEEFYAKRFLKMGAKGYLSKEAPKEELFLAVQTLLDDKMYLSEKVILRFSEFVLDNMPDNIFDTLSVRELEVARHLCKGMRLNEICELMNLHTSTIGTHKARIYEKLGVKNNVELRDLAQLNNILF
jgi:DNA-binding NarL/FixJ family response regulator